MSYNGYVCIDLETTGVYHNTDKIVEIAIICVDRQGAVTERWESTINPSRDLGPTKIHHLRGKDVKYAPSFSEVSDKVFSLVEGRTVIGHNVGFDIKFLTSEWARDGLFIQQRLKNTRVLDTYKYTRMTLSESCEDYEIRNNLSHSAMGDAQATLELFFSIAEEDKRVRKEYKKTLKQNPIFEGSYFPNQITGIPTPRGFLDRKHSHLETENYFNFLDTSLTNGGFENQRFFEFARGQGISNILYLDSKLENMRISGDFNDADMLENFARMIKVNDSYYKEHQSVLKSQPPIRKEEIVLSENARIALTGGFPGYSRSELEELLGFIGYEVKGVAKATELLIAYDEDSLSGKAEKAREYGIPIVGEDWLMGLLKSHGY